MATTISAEEITIDEFKVILGRYSTVLEKFVKPASDGKPSLIDLDTFRYIDAPSRLSNKAGAKTIGLSDLQKLVDWKIRHGKFRPMLPKLVASNVEATVQEVISAAFASYATEPSDVKATINKISELKGIGPATASLVLAVHDPENAIFFSDEVYAWLVSASADLKYNIAEYEELYAKAKEFMSRLQVSPIDLEKVAYVIKKEEALEKKSSESANKSSTEGAKKRGRPKLPEDQKKKPLSNGSGRGRGRPPLSEEEKKSRAAAVSSGKPRGRPKKTESGSSDSLKSTKST
ncbi:hypothetical protein B0O99DRAFT_617493 [Bisporella sp. PMI_857]|nr:hypothetical protein B0O99DRAFT_617493 [Bisporella sp. PMI_857]